MQKISRRALFAGAAGLAAATQLPRPAWAPPALHGIQACNFNKTLLQHPGPIPNMPADDPISLIAYCFRLKSFTSGGIIWLGMGSVTGNGQPLDPSHYLRVSHYVNANNLTFQLEATGADGSYPHLLTAASSIAMPCDLLWHQVIWSADTSSPANVHLAYDGQPIATQLNIANPVGVSCNWQRLTRVGGDYATAGNKSTVVNPLLGDLADVAVFAGGPQIDITDPAIIDQFWDSTDEEPVKNATRGIYVDGRWPQIWLSGPPPFFKGNYTGYPYTWDGAANPFTVTAGSLTQAALDPWDFAGE